MTRTSRPPQKFRRCVVCEKKRALYQREPAVASEDHVDYGIPPVCV